MNAASLLDSILGTSQPKAADEPTSPAPAPSGVSQLDLLFKNAAQAAPAASSQHGGSASSIASPPPSAPSSLLALFANAGAGGSSTPLQSPPPASPPASTNGERSSANLLAMLFAGGSAQSTPTPCVSQAERAS